MGGNPETMVRTLSCVLLRTSNLMERLFFRENPSSHASCQPVSWPWKWGFCLTCSMPGLSPSTWTQSSLTRRRPHPHQWKTSRCWLTVSSSHSQPDQLLTSVPLALWVIPLVSRTWGFPRAISFLFLTVRNQMKNHCCNLNAEWTIMILIFLKSESQKLLKIIYWAK